MQQYSLLLQICSNTYVMHTHTRTHTQQTDAQLIITDDVDVHNNVSCFGDQCGSNFLGITTVAACCDPNMNPTAGTHYHEDGVCKGCNPRESDWKRGIHNYTNRMLFPLYKYQCMYIYSLHTIYAIVHETCIMQDRICQFTQAYTSCWAYIDPSIPTTSHWTSVMAELPPLLLAT